jgi:hypothetical protein
MADRPPPDADVTRAANDALHAWLDEAAGYPMIDADVRDETPGRSLDGERWFLRVLGEAKGVRSLWESAHQRSLHFRRASRRRPTRRALRAPAPSQPQHRRWRSASAMRAGVLRSKLSLEHVSRRRLDRTLGSFYGAVEDAFGTAVR